MTLAPDVIPGGVLVSAYGEATEADFDAIVGDHSKETAFHDEFRLRFPGLAFRVRNFVEVNTLYEAGRIDRLEVDNPSFRPIVRLENPKHAAQLTPFLVPQAQRLLEVVADAVVSDDTVAGFEGNRDFKPAIAVTSVLRTRQRQDQLLAEGALAMDESTHLTGWTFDLDGGGYFLVDDARGIKLPMAAARPYEDVYKAFEKYRDEVDRNAQPPVNPADYGVEYNPAVMRLLLSKIIALNGAGMVNLLHEYPADPRRTVFHVAVNPNRFIHR